MNLKLGNKFKNADRGLVVELNEALSDIKDNGAISFCVKGPYKNNCPSTYLLKKGQLVPTYKFWIEEAKKEVGRGFCIVDDSIAYGYGIYVDAKGQGYGEYLFKQGIEFIFNELKVKNIVASVSTEKKLTKNFMASLFLQLKYRFRIIGKIGSEYITLLTHENFMETQKNGPISDRDTLKSLWKKQSKSIGPVTEAYLASLTQR